jgi:hypothetical protein
MVVLHNLKIEPVGRRTEYARVIVDDMPIKCRGYSINHSIDEVPTVKLELCCIPNYEHDVVIQISNKEEIARLMDETEFEEFCIIWKEVHND